MTSSIAEQLAHLKQTFEVLQDYEGSSVFAETAALLASATTPHDLILVAEAIGDFARTVEARTPLGEAPRCIEILITLLDDECGPEAHKFAARALGNLAFEHAFNIHAIVAGGALPKLAKLLQSHTKAVHEGEALPDHAQVLRNTAGAIVNLASTSDDIRYSMVAEHPILSTFASLIPLTVDNAPVISAMSGRAIANIVECASEHAADLEKQLIDSKLVEVLREALFRAAASEHAEAEPAQLGLLAALSNIFEQYPSGAVVEAFSCASPSENSYIRLAKLAATLPEDTEDEDDVEFQLALVQFLHEVANRDSTRPLLARTAPTIIPLALSCSVQPLQEEALNLLGVIASEDECAAEIFGAAEQLLQLTRTTKHLQVRLYALLVLGNIARTNERCTSLVGMGALPLLRELLRAHYQQSTMTTKEIDPAQANATNHDEDQSAVIMNVKITHMALSVLRHLSIPKSCTQAFLDEQIPALLLSLLNSDNTHILFATLLTLKNIIQGGAEDAVRKLVELNAIALLMDVCTRKFYEDQERVNYEAARALHLLSEASAELRAKVAETSVYPFVLLISTKFHALQLEGLKTLSFLSKSASLREAILAEPLAGTSLVSLVSSENKDVVKLAVVVIANLTDSDAAVPILAPARSAIASLQGDSAFAALEVVLQKLLARLSSTQA